MGLDPQCVQEGEADGGVCVLRFLGGLVWHGGTTPLRGQADIIAWTCEYGQRAVCSGWFRCWESKL